MAELRPHYIDVDLKKNTQYNVPVVTQNDTATHFIIRVTDDGLSDPELLDAYQEITMTSQRPDGESFYLTGIRIPGTNEIEFHLGTDETAFSGSVLASLQFYLVEDASRYTSAQFRYDVKKDLTKNYTPTQREETLVEVVLRDGPVAIQEAKDAKNAVDGALVELEQDKTAAIERLDEVTEENKTIFREPVATFAALSTTYPNPEHGTTVRVTGESAMYRYSDGSWVKTDEYNPTAIDQVTAQLAEKASQEEVNETKQELQATKHDLSQKVGRSETGVLDLNVFDEPTRAAIQGIEPGTINAVLGHKNVQIENVAFIKESVNMINEKDLKAGFTINGTTGAEVANATHSVSTFIPAKPATPYRLANVARWGVYDADKNFIASSTVSAINGDLGYDSHYIRVVLTNSNVGTGTAQLNEGTTLLPYEPFSKPKLSNDIAVDLSGVETVPLDRSVTSPKIGSNAVGIEHLNFIRNSSNLINPNGSVEGYSVDATSGEPVLNPANTLTSFLPCQPAQTYKIAYVNRTAFYDKDKNFISSTATPSTLITPINAHFMRLAITTASLRERAQLNFGDVLLPYEPYYVYLKGVETEPAHQSEDIIKENKYISPLNSNDVYTAPLLDDRSAVSGNNLKELLYSDINNLYSELEASFPGYVSSQLLGTEATGREIYRYDFKPPQVDGIGVKVPKIFIVAGTHGSEKTGVWVTYQMVKALCELWDSQNVLGELRWNVHFIVIPVANPWGWDFITEASGNRTGTRKNSNGVDIARNFPTGWSLGSDPNSATYGGTSPLSELEAQYANTVMENEKNNLVYVCDFHNFFTRNGSIWNASATHLQVNLGEHLVRLMGRKWKKDHEFMPQDEMAMVGYADMGAPSGSIARHATSLGIHGSTFEVSEYCPWENEGTGAGNSPLAIKFGMEAFINFLGLVVKNSNMADK